MELVVKENHEDVEGRNGNHEIGEGERATNGISGTQTKENDEDKEENTLGKNPFSQFLKRMGILESEAQLRQAPKLSYLELFQRFLWFGARAFGGPFAQIQMMKQELVIDEKWVDVDRFIRVFAVYQALPGPEVFFYPLILLTMIGNGTRMLLWIFVTWSHWVDHWWIRFCSSWISWNASPILFV